MSSTNSVSAKLRQNGFSDCADPNGVAAFCSFELSHLRSQNARLLVDENRHVLGLVRTGEPYFDLKPLFFGQ
ncbi:hypothetical protein ACE4RR_10845 [Alteribacillus sp. HJP-4]